MVDVEVAVDAGPRRLVDDGDAGADHPASGVAEQCDVRRVASELGGGLLHVAECADHGFGLLPVGLVALRFGKGRHLVDHGPRRDDDQRTTFGDGGGERLHPGAVAQGAVQHDHDRSEFAIRLDPPGWEDVGFVATDVDVADARRRRWWTPG